MRILLWDVRFVFAAAVAGLLLQPPATPTQPPARLEPEIDARITRVTSVAAGVAFDNPALQLKGTIAPTAAHRLQIVEIALGETAVYAELATFRLVSDAGDEFAPIAVGGRPDAVPDGEAAARAGSGTDSAVGRHSRGHAE